MTIYKINLQNIFLLIFFLQISCGSPITTQQEESHPNPEEQEEISPKPEVSKPEISKQKESDILGKTSFSVIPIIPSQKVFYESLKKITSDYFAGTNLNPNLQSTKDIECIVKLPKNCSLETLEKMANFQESEIKVDQELRLLYSPASKVFYVCITFNNWLKTLFPSLFNDNKSGFMPHSWFGTITRKEIWDVFPEVQADIIKMEAAYEKGENFHLLGKELSDKLNKELEDRFESIQLQSLPDLVLEKANLS